MPCFQLYHFGAAALTLASLAWRAPAVALSAAPPRLQRQGSSQRVFAFLGLPQNETSLASGAGGSSTDVLARRALARRVLNGSEGVADSPEVAAYAHRYRQELSARANIYFLHVSKSAGSYICDCGQRNGCRSPGLSGRVGNCHAEADGPIYDGPVYHNARVSGKLSSCAEMVKLHQEHHYTLVGNENYLAQDGLCKLFWNIIVVRNPVNRLLSWLAMRFEGWVWKQADPKNVTPESIFETWPRESDNYYVRSLLGKEVFYLPPGMLTREHLERAKKRLEEFDTVFVMTPSLGKEISAALGFSCPNWVLRPYGTLPTSEYTSELTRRWSSSDWTKLWARNALDMELKSFADKLAKLDRAVIKHPSFAVAAQQGADRGPSSNSCGFLGAP